MSESDTIRGHCNARGRSQQASSNSNAPRCRLVVLQSSDFISQLFDLLLPSLQLITKGFDLFLINSLRFFSFLESCQRGTKFCLKLEDSERLIDRFTTWNGYLGLGESRERSTCLSLPRPALLAVVGSTSSGRRSPS